MFFQWILLQTNGLLFAILMAISWTIIYLYWFHRPKHFPPGPRGIPFLGIAPYLGPCAERVLAEYGKKYGNVMSFKLGLKDVVVFNDLKAINEGLLKHGADFSGRPSNIVMKELTNDLGIIFVEGEAWKNQRKFSITILKSLGMGKSSYESVINGEVNQFLEIVDSYNAEPFDIMNLLLKCMANIICRILMGQQFNYDDKQLQALISHSPATSITSRIPILRFIPPFRSQYLKIVKDSNHTLDILQGIVDEHKETFDPEDVRDFIDAYIKEMGDSKNSAKNTFFTERQLLHLTRDLLTGGIDTTAATIGWGIVCLLHHPACEETIYDEIIDVVGSDVPSMNHQADMPYLCAFIHEVHRYNTLAPLNIPHRTYRDAEVMGYRIPKGTMVMANIWNTHNDSSVWGNPDVFAPERHLSANGRFVKSDHVIPFAVGHRRCIGEQLAKVELFLFFINFIRKFKLEPDPTEGLPSFEKNLNSIVVTPRKFNLVARLR